MFLHDDDDDDEICSFFIWSKHIAAMEDLKWLKYK